MLQELRRARDREAGMEIPLKPRRRWDLSLPLPRLALAALALILLAPAAYWGLTRERSGSSVSAPLVSDSQEFTPKGDPLKKPTFRVSCLAASGALGPCAPGSTMVFRISPAGFSSFASFAQAPDGKTIWYFPGEAQTTGQSLLGLHSSGVLANGVSIGDGYTPGTYLIHGIFSKSPLTKDQVKDEVRQALSAVPSQAVVVLKQAVTVEGQ